MKKIKKYKSGSYIQPMGKTGQAFGMGANLLGSAIGGGAGNFISGVASGAMAGGPIGAAIGGVGAIIGNITQQNRLAKEERARQKAFTTNYHDQLFADQDTLNENPYGQVFADGGIIPDITQINIEKGELQIDPSTGKILREYTGINPETGGLYAPHSKGKDTKHNIVVADPGTFIITSAKAKLYKDAIDNNDKLLQNTVLQNIRNYKDSKEAKTNKFYLGSYVDDPPTLLQRPQPYNWQSGINMAMDGLKPGYLAPASTTPKLGGSTFNPQIKIPTTTGIAGLKTNPTQNNSNLLDGIGTYGNALVNIGQGLFGKVDNTPQVQATKNPYKSQILNNMPQDISLEPARQQLLRQQGTAFNQIDNTTSGSPIARANKLNVVANTQNQLGMLAMQNQINNNQVRTQRAVMYGNLGAQEMQEANRVQQLNLGIDEQNRANKGVKTQRLDKGLSQLQQAYQNKQAISQQNKMAKIRTEIMRQMFPNLKYYPNFSDEALFGS